jgi:very-short-patch-repair endonuclease
LSVGVGTFNTEQQRAIEDELATLREANPQLEQFFDHANPEHCFVKNIETIQGDERDVIFVSVGYGFDENHLFSQNFGPINKLGGERRLNVLMTRARLQCIIFANFQAEMIPADGASKGLSALRSFLQYAATRTFPITSATPEDSDSPFEDAVGELLENAGFTIRRQVGCAHFRIDIGIVDPVHPGRYLCGIECDGASYHSTRVARDRDRLRQQILQEMGWHIIRVWSTDWYRDRARARAHLLDEVRRLEESDCDQEEPTGSLNVVERESLGGIRPGQSDSTCNVSPAGQTRHQPVVTRPRDVHDAVGQPYTMCTARRGDYTEIDLINASIIEVASSVVQVVLIEGPIHETEVVKRVRALWGLRRTGTRIQGKVHRAISYACSWRNARSAMARPQDGYPGALDAFLDSPIVRKGEFLWPASMKTVSPRRREDASLANMELICDEEIMAAIVLILQSDRSAPTDGLVIGCARVLGIHAVHDQARQRVEAVIDAAVRRSVLSKLPNGNIGLAASEPPSFRVEG